MFFQGGVRRIGRRIREDNNEDNNEENRIESKLEILERQKKQKIISYEISSFVQEVRNKSGWIEKVNNPIIREKYKQECLLQGISEEVIKKGLLILDSIIKCSPEEVINENDLFEEQQQEEEEEQQQQEQQEEKKNFDEIVIEVGNEIILTKLSILRADKESMLSKMFSPKWMSNYSEISNNNNSNNNDGDNDNNKNKPRRIETISNSSIVFKHILRYLEYLLNHSTTLNSTITNDNVDWFNELNDLSIEEYDELREDSNYLGLRKFLILLDSKVFLENFQIGKQQVDTNSLLHNSKRKLVNLIEEKRRLEQRLLELPSLIQQAEEDVQQKELQTLIPKSRGKPNEGDIIRALIDSGAWIEHEVLKIDGETMVKQKRSHFFGSINNTSEPYPLPEPHKYHRLSQMLCSCGTYYYDNFLPSTLLNSLENHLDQLLHKMSIDLHPGSDGHVVDLIHPSLYPYIKGVTQVSDEEELKKCEKIDGTYCWLPSEFNIDSNGNVKIESYINNLNRLKYPELYFDIELTFKFMLPLFETVLKQKLTSRNLQVIVKSAYYFIPPGEFYEGSWHIEGMPYEHIIASGIYYISSSENITENEIIFRTLQDENSAYQYSQGHAGQEHHLVYELGSVDTPTGRGIVWNNKELQHKVGSLYVYPEEEQSGIRKILCFFLIDPSKRIVSTKIVPEQQNLIPFEVALEHRQNLMNDRKYQATLDANDWERRTITLCEH